MIINHLIVGSSDIPASLEFYCDFLGFKKTSDDPGAEGGQVLVRDRSELILIPTPKERLPNPIHFALEVDSLEEFENLLSKAQKMNLSPRSIPSKNSKSGASKFSRGRYQYKIFYVFDPLGVNLEIMVKV